MTYSIEERTLHFKQPAGTSRGVYTTRRSWFVTLADDKGNRGVGECAPLPNLSCDDIPDYRDKLEQIVKQYCESGQLPIDELRQYPSMLFGMETALAYVYPDRHQLFETPFARGMEGIPFNGLVWMGSYEEMLKRMEEKLRLGFRCVKIKIGAIDFDDELRLLKLIRHRFSKDTIELRVDANGAFKPNEAMEKLHQLSRFGIHSIEQPIRQGQWEQMAELCSKSPLPIALDEELIGINDLQRKAELIDAIRPSYLVLKPSLHGGMSGTREWIDVAAAKGVGSWITSALESNVGLMAIALLCAEVYGSDITFPQGLGTGQLFTDNIPMPLEIRGDKLWISGRN